MIGFIHTRCHGYYCDVVDFDQIEAKDRLGYIKLQEGAFEMQFSPIKKHFAGFEINLLNQPEENKGTLTLSILDDTGRQVDTINVDLSKVHATVWYKAYTNKSLKKGKIYTLRISANDCETVPYLQIVNPDYLTDENISGDILLGYAYAESTFTPQNKVLISLFIIAIGGLICAGLISDNSVSRATKYVAVFMLLTVVLSWNYMYNSMDNQNSTFEGFQGDSETLVSDMIAGEHKGVRLESGYGLGWCLGIQGMSYDHCVNGYSKAEPVLIVKTNDYIRDVAVAGNYIGLENGDIFQITKVEFGDDSTTISLDTVEMLSEAKYGMISNAVFYNANMEVLERGLHKSYKSQFGLQGKVFRHLARHMKYENAITHLNLICSMATAVILVFIVVLVAVKYDKIFAGCFFVTFWLSPWVINFARNLYWVEFTWFLPMTIGLFCARKINNKICRICSYVLAFISIVGKCLCGYEYITSIMMGMVFFLCADLIAAFDSDDRRQAVLIFKTTVIIGVVALLGFMTAICIHAPLRGEGDVVKGIINIFEQDVLRRTAGADLNAFSEVYWPSFNASAWEVLCKYFHFQTEILTGVNGNLFPLLCIIPVLIFAYQFKKKKLNYELVGMYVLSFFTAVSWFVLAKSHSYIHTHMNYVLWYMGYVQICFYIIIRWIIDRAMTLISEVVY